VPPKTAKSFSPKEPAMRLFALLCLTALLGSPLLASDWPNWRGPGFNGVASGTGYPTEWSATKNVTWKVKLPGKGSSTPVSDSSAA
jgi:hypothetical protein